MRIIKQGLRIWDENKFEIILGLCVLFLIIYAIIRLGKKGNWNTHRDGFHKQYTSIQPTKKRGPPRESKGEIECKRVLEQLFSKPFNKVRPAFLMNPVTGGNFNLEIDCYNDDLKLGIEYSGKQHYEYVPYFHKNREAFLNQKYRDEIKRSKCRDNGVILIEVPYTVKIHDIYNFLRKELNRNGYNV